MLSTLGEARRDENADQHRDALLAGPHFSIRQFLGPDFL
jgi:hypothetical protein